MTCYDRDIPHETIRIAIQTDGRLLKYLCRMALLGTSIPSARSSVTASRLTADDIGDEKDGHGEIPVVALDT
jgi:hypothetical protein